MGSIKYFQLIGITCLLFVSTESIAEKLTKEMEMPFYIGKVLPTPQKATYFKEFLPLAKAAVLTGKNVPAGDLLVKLLRERIESRSGGMKIIEKVSAASDAETIIVLGNHELAKDIMPPDKVQGYIICMKKRDGKNIIFLKGHDRQGLSWAISSLIQLITVNKGVAAVEKAEIVDFPDTANRGLWMNSFQPLHPILHYAFTFKINTVFFPRVYRCFSKKEDQPSFWRKGGNKAFADELNEVGDFFNPLGIKWFAGIFPISGTAEEKINCASEKDFNSIYAMCEKIAQAGGSIMFLMDDHRFPRNPEEKKTFATAREADTYFIRKLHKKLKDEFPKTELMFCNPFYWGPAAPPAYPESREKYLKAVGELPEDIRIAWNGPHVCSSTVTAEDLKWETDLIKRKPDIFIFRGGPHMFRYHYITDVVDYSASYYDGFLEGINTYIHCVCPPTTLAAVGIQTMNYLWNTGEFEPVKSTRMICEMMIGSGSFESVDKVNKALSYFDQWALKPSPGAAKQINVFKSRLKILQEAYNVCEKEYPAIKKWSQFKYLTARHGRLLRQLNGLDLKQFSHADKLLKSLATKEAGYNDKTHVFFSPYDFTGGHSPKYYQYRCENRLCTWIRGKGTSISRMSTSFRLSDKSLSALKELVICAQDDDADQKCPIKICINSSTVFERPNPFTRFGWNIKKFSIGKGILKEGRNTLSIECLSKSDIAHGPPFFIVNYVVLKSTE